MQENFERRAGNFLARRSNWCCYALFGGEGLHLGDDAYLRVAEELDDETTSIENSSLFQPKAAVDGWYTLDGRKLDKKPTAKGVYVNNNRKVVIK